MTEETKPLKISIVRASDYRTVYSTGVFGSLSPVEGRMIFYLDRPIPILKEAPPGSMEVGEIERELQIEIRLSTAQWIAMSNWMQKHLEELKKKGILKPIDIEESG